MTHNNPQVIASAEFFARVVFRVLQGDRPVAAIEKAAGEGDKTGKLKKWVADGLESRTIETRRAISGFGQMCEVEAAFPATIHLIARYPENLKEALVENIMAGGDSAARGMLVGMVLGAHLGPEAIPQPWLEEMTHYRRIRSLFEKII